MPISSVHQFVVFLFGLVSYMHSAVLSIRTILDTEQK